MTRLSGHGKKQNGNLCKKKIKNSIAVISSNLPAKIPLNG
ncbi:hypothetical protein NEOC95_000560 [Neochlamydia sp. AcF95]|nr:hypothetical protein [Neochlamydia sp. AcF95]